VKKRIFSDTEKKKLFLIANGKCKLCSVELKKGWHADHIIPYSKGGKTILNNGQALCPKCNLKKSNKLSEIILRKWQDECFNKLLSIQNNRKTFLCVAGVGSGKTTFSSYSANYFLKQNRFRNIIVISPRDAIKNAWSENFSINWDIELDSNYSFKYDWSNIYNGISITYYALNEVNTLFLLNLIDDRTLIILDEIHHAAENKTWGDSVQKLGDKAGFVLMLSGTPYRSDNNKIPFVTYKKTSEKHYELISDFYYSYGESVKDNVCCPVLFHKKGSPKILTSTEVLELSYSEDLEESKRALNKAITVLKGGDCYVYSTFLEANKKLNEISDRRLKNYAGLIICNSVKDANTLYDRIVSNFGEEFVDIVTSQDSTSSKIIKSFSTSNKSWLISVNMVSEGVDIPRIRVIQYATNFTTLLYFIQVLGRGVRNFQIFENDIDCCHMYIPDYKELVDNAELIENEIRHIVEDIQKQEKERQERKLVNVDNSLFEMVLSADVSNNGEIFSGEHLDNSDMQQAEILGRRFSATPETVVGIMTHLKKSNSVSRPEIKTIVKKQHKTLSEKVKDARKQIHKLVGKISYKTEMDFGEIHSKLNLSACGVYKETNQLSYDELTRKLHLAKRLYENA